MDHTNERVVVRTAYFTDHKTKKTAVAVSVDSTVVDGTTATLSTETYGLHWLKTLRGVISLIHKEFKGNVDLVLVSGQPECVKLAVKVERIFIKMLKSKKEMTLDRIKRIVAADGNFKSLPNDELYIDVAELLWQCRNKFSHFSFEQHHKPSPAAAKVFNIARDLVFNTK